MPAPLPAPPPVDGASATPSLRTLGTGAQQAAAGNDARLGGWVQIVDVTPNGVGVVSAKVYQDTGNTILQSCNASLATLTVSVRASYPLITVNGTAGQLTLAGTQGHYAGSVNIVIPGGTTNVDAVLTTPNGQTGARDTVAITYAAPPEILSLDFVGGYPGAQTELKAGDTYQVSGTTDVAATSVVVSDFGAGISQTISFASTTNFTVTITIADRGTTPQSLRARMAARNAVGAAGATADTASTVVLNNLYPTVTFGAVTYPVGQGALKDAESATVAVTTANLNTIAYTSPNGDLSITNPNTDEATKTVSRIAGSYNVATTNFRAVATRNANAAVTTTNGVVKIAHVACTVTVVPPAARLRSGGNNGTAQQSHTISLQANQELYEAPTLNADAGGGTFSGVWAGGPSTWTRSLAVHDDDTKGTYTWQALSAKNLAGIITNAVTSGGTYVLGGFVQRTLTFAAFSQTTTLNVGVVTYTKLQAGIFTATNQPALRNAVQGNHDNILNTYTVDSLGNTGPTTLFWNDLNAANSNSGGTAQITAVEETV